MKITTFEKYIVIPYIGDIFAKVLIKGRKGFPKCVIVMPTEAAGYKGPAVFDDH